MLSAFFLASAAVCTSRLQRIAEWAGERRQKAHTYAFWQVFSTVLGVFMKPTQVLSSLLFGAQLLPPASSLPLPSSFFPNPIGSDHRAERTDPELQRMAHKERAGHELRSQVRGVTQPGGTELGDPPVSGQRVELQVGNGRQLKWFAGVLTTIFKNAKGSS